MKTYNLTSGTFWGRDSNGDDCYCALGILLNERGYKPLEFIHRGWFILRGELLDDVDKMASAMKSAIPAEWHDRDAVDLVYGVNDADVSDDGWETSRPRFELDVIQAALKGAGIEVELIDKRGPGG